MMTPRIVTLGFLCSRGHFCFFADPDENGECGSKDVGAITLTFSDDLRMDERAGLLDEATDSLREKLETWRNCTCDEANE